MRVLMTVAVIALAVAFLGAIGALAVNVLGWFIGGMLAWAVDVLVGGYVVPVGQPRA